ncbi:MAG: hypothetical protein ACLQE9_23380, partial [Roseiarcus sp.]
MPVDSAELAHFLIGKMLVRTLSDSHFRQDARPLIYETPVCAWFSRPRRSGLGGQTTRDGTMSPTPMT